MSRSSTTETDQITIDIIQSATGKSPVEWHGLMSEKCPPNASESDCIKLLTQDFGIRPELARHLTEMHFALRTKLDSSEEITTVTKTFPLAIHVVESYFTSGSLRESWLGEDFTPSLINTGRNIRLEGALPGKVFVNFNGKGPAKCQITVQHLKLASREQAEEIRKYWKARLDILAEVLKVNDTNEKLK
ncbi:MAG: hypothetical protein KDC13_05300 [Bacteroidetes bacterium]|nr:hypothetical protein [Bacteroidota bacterium]